MQFQILKTEIMIIHVPSKQKQSFESFCNQKDNVEIDLIGENIKKEQASYIVNDYYNEFEFGRMFESWMLKNSKASES